MADVNKPIDVPISQIQLSISNTVQYLSVRKSVLLDPDYLRHCRHAESALEEADLIQDAIHALNKLTARGLL